MLGPVSVSVPTLLIEVVIFLAMVGAMQALVFGPIREKWAERDRLIAAGLAASSEGRDDAEQARNEVQHILGEARRAAQQEIDASTKTGNEIRDQLVAQASTKFRELVAAAQTQISAERERSAAELRHRIVDIALQAAMTVTGQAYDQPQVRELAAAVVSSEGLE